MALIRDRDGVFKVGTQGTILCDDGPVVSQRSHIAFARVHHRFNGQGHSRCQAGTFPRRPEIGDTGFLMKLLPHPMTHILTDDGEPGTFSNGLDSMGDISDPVPGFRFSQALCKERFLRYFEETGRLIGNIPDGIRPG